MNFSILALGDPVFVDDPDSPYHICDGTIVDMNGGEYIVEFESYAADGRASFKQRQLVYGHLHSEE